MRVFNNMQTWTIRLGLLCVHLRPKSRPLQRFPRQSSAAIVDDDHFEVSPGLLRERTDTVGQLRIRGECWNGNSYPLLRQALILTRFCAATLTFQPNPSDLALTVEECEDTVEGDVYGC